jgi:protein dithiol:quinone oxidoreductase
MPFGLLGLSRRLVLALIGLAGLGLVAGGIVMARTMNLAACPLCILQRMLYLLLSVQALALLPWSAQRLGQFAAVLMGLTAATGAGIAGYQTWLQRFATDTRCAVDLPWWERLVYWAGEQSPLLFEATGLCSEAGWLFMGLSIAEWSLLIFIAMSIAAFASVRSAQR